LRIYLIGGMTVCGWNRKPLFISYMFAMGMFIPSAFLLATSLKMWNSNDFYKK